MPYTDDTITINVADQDYSDDTITINVADSCIADDMGLYGTLLDDNYFNNNISIGPNNIMDAYISVGSTVLSEDKLQKLSALLDIIEDDPEWAERLQTQLAFNKLRNSI